MILPHPIHAWIEEHMPELDAELSQMHWSEFLPKLNAITGLNFSGGDLVEQTLDGYLEKLKELQK